jgi:hypothetical protein
MAYFDISSMLVALRDQPDAFCLSEGWLIHLPSRHRFKVQAEGSIIIDAACGDAGLSVHAEQGRQLYQAVGSWRTEYWIPHEISGHFANHFRPASQPASGGAGVAKSPTSGLSTIMMALLSFTEKPGQISDWCHGAQTANLPRRACEAWSATANEPLSEHSTRV